MANRRSQLSDKKQKREGSLIFSNSSAMLGAPLYSGRSGSARSQVTKVPTTSELPGATRDKNQDSCPSQGLLARRSKGDKHSKQTEELARRC